MTANKKSAALPFQSNNMLSYLKPVTGELTEEEKLGRKRSLSAPLIQETVKRSIIKEAAKACSLSSQTRTTFVEAYGQTVEYPTECGDLKPTVRLANEAMVLFIREWVPTLATCDAVLRYGKGEKPKYFAIFTLLSLAAALSGSRCDPLGPDEVIEEEDLEAIETLAAATAAAAATTKSGTEQDSSEQVRTGPTFEAENFEVLPFADEDYKLLRRYIGHEEKLSGGNIEFTTHGTAFTQIIDSLWEIKSKLTSLVALFTAEKSEIWQFYTELISANNKNLSCKDTSDEPQPVWGALSDDQTWIFAKLTNPPGGKILIELSAPLTLHKGRTMGLACTADTAEVINFLFSAIHGSALATDVNTISAERMAEMIHNVHVMRAQAVEKTCASFADVSAGALTTNMVRNMVMRYKNTNKDNATLEACAKELGIAPGTVDYAVLEGHYNSVTFKLPFVSFLCELSMCSYLCSSFS